MKQITKNLKLIVQKSRMSIMQYFEYRTSLFFYTLGSFTWAFASIFLQKYIFDQIGTLKGWTFPEYALLYGMYNLSFAFFIMFSWNTIYGEFRRAVRYGELDTLLTKPVPHKLFSTFGSFDIAGMLHVIPSMTIIFFALQIGNLSVSTLDLLLAFFYFLAGQYVINSIAYLFYATTFWFTSAEHISSAFWSIESQSKNPLEILPKSLRFIFLTLIPIGFVAYIPVKALLGELDISFLLYSILFLIVLKIINSIVWKKGTQRYESASS